MLGPILLQHNRHKNTKKKRHAGSLPCLSPLILPNLSLQTHSACKLAIFVLMDHKYWFGKVVWANKSMKCAEMHCWKILLSFLLLLFLASALRPKDSWMEGEQKSMQCCVCAHRADWTVDANNTHTGTLTDGIAEKYKKTLRNGETSSLSFHLTKSFFFIHIFFLFTLIWSQTFFLKPQSSFIPHFLSKVRGCRCCFSLATQGGAVPLCRWLTGGGCVYC